MHIHENINHLCINHHFSLLFLILSLISKSLYHSYIQYMHNKLHLTITLDLYTLAAYLDLNSLGKPAKKKE